MILKIKNGAPIGEDVVVELEFMDEAPSESIQPQGFPFVAKIRYPHLESEYCEYLVARVDGLILDVRAWDEEDGPHGDVMDSWYESPMDKAKFRSLVLNYAATQDPKDWHKAVEGN